MILLLSSCHYEPSFRAATSATQSDHRGSKVERIISRSRRLDVYPIWGVSRHLVFLFVTGRPGFRPRVHHHGVMTFLDDRAIRWNRIIMAQGPCDPSG